MVLLFAGFLLEVELGTLVGFIVLGVTVGGLIVLGTIVGGFIELGITVDGFTVLGTTGITGLFVVLG